MDYHSEFALQSLLFISRMAANGDYETPLRLGIRPDQVEKILSLNAQEIYEMAAISKVQFYKLTFDSESLDMAFDICSQHIQQRQQIIQLLKAGASLPVMKQLYGLTSVDLARIRKHLNLPSVNGRPMHPSEADQYRIWESWKNTQLENLSIAESLLFVHQQTQLKINAIWPLIQEWFIDRTQ